MKEEIVLQYDLIAAMLLFYLYKKCYYLNMRKIIAHIDINQFFAAATILLEPELKGKPLIIAGDNRRGIVSTASYEARNYGIHSAMPTYQANILCPKLVIRQANFEWYNKKSNEFFEYLKTNYTVLIEPASIDECYLDLTDVMKDEKNPMNFLKTMQENIYNNTLLDVSIGLGPTKFLAKMASDYKKPKGITIIRKRDIPKILYPLKIKDFFGVGKKSSEKLNDLGIYTIGDFAISDSYEVKKVLGSFYNTMKEWINGQGDDFVNPNPFDPKSISSSTTFLNNTNDYEEIREYIEKRAREVSQNAQKENKIGKTITLVLKDENFHQITRSITIDKPTNSFIDIYTNSINLFDKYFNNQTFRLVGVGLSQLINKEDFYVQVSLFDQEKNIKECKSKLLVNKLNRKANKDVFILASNLKNKEGKKNEI